MTSIGPYSMGAKEFRPRRGQYGERAKSVKKNAAPLHFLAFGPFDHNFGVPRGERLAAKTMAASLLRKPARVVIRPAGANIARSPVSLRSTVAPCSQPRNPLGRAPRLGTSGTFLLLFWSQKSRHNGNRQLKKALPQGRQGRRGCLLRFKKINNTLVINLRCLFTGRIRTHRRPVTGVGDKALLHQNGGAATVLQHRKGGVGAHCRVR